MRIKYLGHSCFFVKCTKALVFDPFHNIGYDLEPVTCDYVFCSHGHFDHNASELVKYEKLFDLNGTDLNADGIKCQKLICDHDDCNGEKRGKNAVFKIEMDGIIIVHLGDIGKVTKAVVDFVSGADVLFVPIGGKYTIDFEQALRLITDCRPKSVFPMHYKILKSNIDVAPLGDFLSANPFKTAVISGEANLIESFESATSVYIFNDFLK